MRSPLPSKQTSKKLVRTGQVYPTLVRGLRGAIKLILAHFRICPRARVIFIPIPHRAVQPLYTPRENAGISCRERVSHQLSLSLGGVSFTTERPTAHACASLTDTLRPDARGSISFFRAACCVSSGIRCARRYTRTHNRQKEGKPPR